MTETRLHFVVLLFVLGVHSIGIEAAEPRVLEPGDYVLPAENWDIRVGDQPISLRGRSLPFVVQRVDGDVVDVGLGHSKAAGLVHLDDAEAYYTSWLERDPQSVDAYHLRATARFKHRRYDEAIADYSAAIVQAPDNARLRTKRAQANLLQFRRTTKTSFVEAAARDADMAVRLDSREVWAVCLQGFAKIDRLDMDGMSFFRRARMMTPPDELSYFARAEMFLWLREIKTAADECTEALRLNPYFEEVRLYRGVLYNVLGMGPDYQADMEQAYRFSPKSPQVLMSRALQKLYEKESPEALAEVRRAAELSPRDGDNWSSYARALLELKDQSLRNPQAAVAAALKATELEPKFFRAHYSLGRAYGEAGDFGRAILALQAAKDLKDNRRTGDAEPATIDGWIQHYHRQLTAPKK